MKRIDENFVLTNYGKMSNKEISKALNCNIGSVLNCLHRNGIYSRKFFSKEDIEYMINNYQNMKYSEIAKNLGYTEKQIKDKLSNMGFSKLRKFNKNYFSVIDENIKAYFLGFIFADGWVCKRERNYELGMQLQSKDKYVLEKLNQGLGGVHDIKHYDSKNIVINNVPALRKEADRLRVYSKDIVEDLIKLGVETNKSKKDVYPKVPDEYFFDFLRGYIDGDGCYFKQRKNVYVKITCSSDKVLQWVKDKLINYDINSHIYFETENKYNLEILDRKSVVNLINKIYYDKNLFCLKRKFEIVKDICGSAT